MLEVITNPATPYIDSIPRNLVVGNGVRIFGIARSDEETFWIRLQCSNELSNPDDVAVCFSMNLKNATATVNCRRSGVWDDSVKIQNVPIRSNQKFEVLIKCDTNQYKIFINTRFYCSFPQRIPVDFITHLAISGDVSIEKICYEAESLAIETPPPSYDEAQARAFANQSSAADPLLQPTQGRPPYPIDTNPLFQPTPNNRSYETDMYYNPYQTQTVTNVPPTALNAASPNFRPVQKSKTKKLIRIVLIMLVVIILVVLASTLFSTKSKHKYISN